MEQSLIREEIFDIPDELVTVLASEDTDFQLLRACTTAQQTLNTLWEDNQNQVKDEIIALTQEYTEEKTVVDKLKDNVSTAKVQQSHSKLKQATDSMKLTQSQMSELKENLHKCEAEMDRLEDEKDRILNDTTKVIPEKRHDVNLYHYLTGVRWQYECPQQDIQGYVANKKAVKPFSLNSSQNSEFFIANYLWDLIENEWD